MPETIEISDQDLIRRIARQQQRRGDKTTTRTAGKLLTEYLTLLEHGAIKTDAPADPQPEPASSAA